MVQTQNMARGMQAFWRRISEAARASYSQAPRCRGMQAFWRRISEGIAIQQLWAQFHGEARATYRFYSREVDWTRREQETRGQKFKRVASGLFWAMVLK